MMNDILSTLHSFGYNNLEGYVIRGPSRSLDQQYPSSSTKLKIVYIHGSLLAKLKFRDKTQFVIPEGEALNSRRGMDDRMQACLVNNLPDIQAPAMLDYDLRVTKRLYDDYIVRGLTPTQPIVVSYPPGLLRSNVLADTLLSGVLTCDTECARVIRAECDIVQRYQAVIDETTMLAVKRNAGALYSVSVDDLNGSLDELIGKVFY